nr:MAG TPA: hypothetical protein [Caudoviricetes sp.]
MVGTALQSCPALALQGKSPSLAVVSSCEAPMLRMVRFLSALAYPP